MDAHPSTTCRGRCQQPGVHPGAFKCSKLLLPPFMSEQLQRKGTNGNVTVTDGAVRGLGLRPPSPRTWLARGTTRVLLWTQGKGH